MGALTEAEIFDQLTQSLRISADLCDVMARNPVRGASYMRLVRELKLIEGCCRQAAVWREDCRWLNFAPLINEAHKRAGEWLRGYKMPNGQRIKIADGTLHPCFVKLAENLRELLKVVLATKTNRTGHVGMILPDTSKGPTRTQGRPMQVLLPPGMQMSKGGVILPSGAAA